MLTLRRMRVLIAICFCASIAFLVYYTLQSDKLFSAVGLALSVGFLSALKSSNSALKIDEGVSIGIQRIREQVVKEIQHTGVRSPTRADIAFTLIIVQLFAQMQVFAVGAILLAGGGFFLHRLNEVANYAIAFGALAFAMLVIAIICVLRHSP